MDVQDQARSRFRNLAKRLECPVDQDADYRNSFWCNRDLIPIPAARRTWTWQGYAGYWVITGVNTAAWTAGSTLLALGLSVNQAMGIVVGAALVSGILAVVCGWMGSHQYLGFTVASRASWGMRGAFWPVLNRIMTASIWMGVQSYWGGQAILIVLSAVIGPKYANMKNALPESAHVTSVSLLSFFIFLAIYAPLLLVRPEKLQLFLRISFVMIISTLFGMLIWAMRTAHGAGTLIHTPPTVHGATSSWSALYGLQAIIGLYASGTLGQSDWTRYARTPNAALIGQAVTAPLTIVLTALFGLLITSATHEIYGQYFWNPFQLLVYIQSQSLSPATRAGTFFAGLGFLASQLALCIVLNGVSAGMDIAALCPRYLNIRRGTYLVTLIAVAICPWNYVTQPTTFIVVLSGWAVFLSPMTGILLSDYFWVRHQELRIADLYLGDRRSAYWYTAGVNWRGVLAWAMGLWPLLPGFVRQVRGVRPGTENGWDRLYQISYFYGFFVAAIVYRLLYFLVPADRMRGRTPFVMQARDSDGSSISEEVEKTTQVMERKTVDESQV